MLCSDVGAAYHLSQNRRNPGTHLARPKILRDILWTYTLNYMPTVKTNKKESSLVGHCGGEVFLQQFFPLLFDVPSIIRKSY